MNKTIDPNIEDIVRGAYTILASDNPSILKSVSENHYFITGVAIGNNIAILIDLTKKLNPYCSWEEYIEETKKSYNKLMNDCRCYYC